MQTSESSRFFAYVERTSRPAAWEKRKSIFSHLCGRNVPTVRDMVATINGNTKDRDWISQAIKDGEIIRLEDGALAPPEPTSGLDPRVSLDISAAWDVVVAFYSGPAAAVECCLRRYFPEAQADWLSKRTDELIGQFRSNIAARPQYAEEMLAAERASAKFLEEGCPRDFDQEKESRRQLRELLDKLRGR